MKYKISIPEPCHEDWAKMTPNEKGRFCDSCEKTIIDFTNYSKFELAKRINSGESICGRFKNEQLNTPLNYRNPIYQRGSTWVLSLAGLLVVTAASVAQPSSEAPNTLIELIENESKNLEPDKDTILLKSRVLNDSTGQAVLKVSVQVKEYKKIMTQTDEQGHFTLAVPNKFEEISLVFQLENFEEKEVKVDLRKRNLSRTIFMTEIHEEVHTVEINKEFAMIKSTVIDSVTKESIPFATIKVLVNDEMIGGAMTDFDGNFELKISPTTKDFVLEITNVSYESIRLNVNLEEDSIPDRIAMTEDETSCYITMGLVITEPVNQNNDYLKEQVRKYYR